MFVFYCLQYIFSTQYCVLLFTIHIVYTVFCSTVYNTYCVHSIVFYCLQYILCTHVCDLLFTIHIEYTCLCSTVYNTYCVHMFVLDTVYNTYFPQDMPRL